VSEVERNLRLLDDVLKYQTVKLNDEVVRDTVAVAPEDVKFEYVEPPPEGEESLARELGLEERHDRDREHERRDRDPYADDVDEMGEEEVAAANAMGGEDE